jgi:hypothetical protein
LDFQSIGGWEIGGLGCWGNGEMGGDGRMGIGFIFYYSIYLIAKIPFI